MFERVANLDTRVCGCTITYKIGTICDSLLFLPFEIFSVQACIICRLVLSIENQPRIKYFKQSIHLHPRPRKFELEYLSKIEKSNSHTPPIQSRSLLKMRQLKMEIYIIIPIYRIENSVRRASVKKLFN